MAKTQGWAVFQTDFCVKWQLHECQEPFPAGYRTVVRLSLFISSVSGFDLVADWCTTNRSMKQYITLLTSLQYIVINLISIPVS